MRKSPVIVNSGLKDCRFYQIGYVLNLLNVEGISTDKELTDKNQNRSVKMAASL